MRVLKTAISVSVVTHLDLTVSARSVILHAMETEAPFVVEAMLTVSCTQVKRQNRFGLVALSWYARGKSYINKHHHGLLENLVMCGSLIQR